MVKLYDVYVLLVGITKLYCGHCGSVMVGVSGTSQTKKQLRENEAATENLIKALEKGTAIELISTQIEKRQQEKLLFETELAKEKILSPNLTFEQVKFYFDKYKQGDINSTEFRPSIVDTSIYIAMQVPRI